MRPPYPLITVPEPDLATLRAAEKVLGQVLQSLPAGRLRIHLTASPHMCVPELTVIQYTVTSGASIGPHCYSHTLAGALVDLAQRSQPER